jgi:hypothetical protein
LATCARDLQEASSVVNRVDQVRHERLLAEHDPYRAPGLSEPSAGPVNSATTGAGRRLSLRSARWGRRRVSWPGVARQTPVRPRRHSPAAPAAPYPSHRHDPRRSWSGVSHRGGPDDRRRWSGRARRCWRTKMRTFDTGTCPRHDHCVL